MPQSQNEKVKIKNINLFSDEEEIFRCSLCGRQTDEYHLKMVGRCAICDSYALRPSC